MIRYIFRKVHELWGWKITGDDPNLVPKKIYVVLPHTSNWDFPVGILMKVFMPLDVRWIAKDSLFKWPLGGLFRAMGGIAVNRDKAKNFVDTMVSLYDENEKFSTAIAPEGTRKKVTSLKSGYYYIAKGANIPIIYTKFDWGNMTVRYETPKQPEETWEEELDYAMKYFKNTVGRIPENSIGYPFGAS